MVGTADVDEGAELGSNGAFKRGEHGVCVFIIHGDDVEGIVGSRDAFLVWYDIWHVRCKFEVYGGCSKVFVVVMNVCEERVCGAHAE